MKTCILLVNLGTPDAPTAGAVGRYLREFLGDGRVIDVPWLPRKILVNGIIAPIRKYRSAREYRKFGPKKALPCCCMDNPCNASYRPKWTPTKPRKPLAAM